MLKYIQKIIAEGKVRMSMRNINIENRLHQLCIEDPEYAELWSTWNLNKQTLEPILNAIIKDYPHYSFHDRSHSESILLNIERILGAENIGKLSPTDLWLLLHVSYLHDFGMVILDTKIYEIWRSDEFQEFVNEKLNSTDDDPAKAAYAVKNSDKLCEDYSITWPLEVKKATTVLLSSYCRSKHAEFSREYILDIKNVWGIDLGHSGLIKNRLISLIGEISTMHTKPFDEILSLYKESNGFKNDYMHPRLVACMLRMGDVLDLDNGRFNHYGTEIFGEMPKESKRHYEKHEATKHVLVTNEVIEVEADCSTDDVYRETRKWLDSLKSEIDNLRLSWNDIAPAELGRPPKLAICKITRNGTDVLNELSNLKFNISQKKAFEIIEGSSIYKDKFACLRELVQNAEDASKIQLWRDIKNGIYYCKNGIDRSKVEAGTLLPNDIPSWIYEIYSIEIDVSRNEKNCAVVTIKDHGTGISAETLKAICDVGQSYRSRSEAKKEIGEMPEWLKPTANFGIGLQSCFMATDKFDIVTKSDTDSALEITFESGKDSGYVSVKEPSENIARGSMARIEFKPDMTFSYDMFGFTAQHLMNIEPFETNCIVIYKIIESIFKECDSSFFNINVSSEELDLHETISSHFAEKDGEDISYIKREDFLYRLSADNKLLTVWYNNSLFKINFIAPRHFNLKFLFKGKNVDKNRYINSRNYVGFNIAVDIYGIPTKDALSLNREELTANASKKMIHDLNDVIGLYMDLLSEKKDEIKCSSDIVNSYFLSSWIYQKHFPKDLYQNISDSKNIQAVVYNEDTSRYEETYVSLSSISDVYPRLSYCDCDHDDYLGNDQKGTALKELIKALNNSNIDRKEFDRIIVDKKIRDFLEITFCDCTYIPSDKSICIKTANVGDDLYSPDPYTRETLIRHLVYSEKKEYKTSVSMYIMRRAIHAFDGYEKLATKLDKVFFLGHDGKAKWHIISPISLDDAERLGELSREAFIKYIVDGELFGKIVSYVMENAKNKGVSRESIIKDYERLIGEYYDLRMKDHETD